MADFYPKTSMTNKLARLFVVVAMLAWSTACQKAALTNSNTSVPAPSATPANVNSSVAAPPVNDSPVNVSLATPTDTYKTGYAARKNKDVAMLKRVLAKDALAFLTEMGQLDNKTLDDQLKELADKPQAATAETRNEKINGNRASLEYLDPERKMS